jgi:hypothetical protein
MYLLFRIISLIQRFGLPSQTSLATLSSLWYNLAYLPRHLSRLYLLFGTTCVFFLLPVFLQLAFPPAWLSPFYLGWEWAFGSGHLGVGIEELVLVGHGIYEEIRLSFVLISYTFINYNINYQKSIQFLSNPSSRSKVQFLSNSF